MISWILTIVYGVALLVFLGSVFISFNNLVADVRQIRELLEKREP